MTDHTHEDGYAAETHTRAEVFDRTDGRYDFRIVADENGDILCSSSQGYENAADALHTAKRVLRAALLGQVTFGLVES